MEPEAKEAVAAGSDEPTGVAKRMMASIQIVKDIKPIVGADKILKATVLGWDTVIKVNEFNEGGMHTLATYTLFLFFGPANLCNDF
jgi:hypothetical protein